MFRTAETPQMQIQIFKYGKQTTMFYNLHINLRKLTVMVTM
jgi:hypothetical protein